MEWKRNLNGYTYVFGSKFFTGVHANLTRCFLYPEIPRWQMYTGSSYSFAMENDIKVISVAVECGTSDSLPLVSALSDFGDQHQVQTGSRNSTQNRKY